MDVIIDNVKKQSESMGHTIVYTTDCKENSCSILKKDSIINITDFGIDIYSKGKGNLRTSLPWIAISRVKIQNNDIYLKFSSKSVTISSELASRQIFGAIIHCLQQILSSFEIQLLHVDQFNVPKAKHSGYGALIRFAELARTNGKLISPEAYDKFKTFLMTSQRELDLSLLGDPQTTLPLFLGTLPLTSTIQSVSIPYIPMFPTYQVLADYAASVARLNYIDIAGKAGETFKLFIMKMSNMQNSKLLGLSFTNSDLTNDNLTVLSEYVGKQRISSIAFHNAILYDSLPFFYSNFFTSNMIGSLTVLNLDGTKNLDVQKLFPVLRNIYVLSLENCGLPVDRILSQISLCGLRNLRALNVSNNICEHLPISAITLPQTLISFVANNIRWSDLCLVNIFKIVFSRRKVSTKLSLSYANSSPDEWSRVWSYLNSCTYDNLISFTWDGNPIHVSLFTFLLINQQLEYLSMCDVFSQNEPNAVSVFGKYLEKSEAIKFLIVKGGNQKYLGRLIGAVTRIAITKKTLVHLDIGNNRIGDNGLEQLKPLYTQVTALKMVNFDGSYPQTKDTLIYLLDLASKSLEKIKTSFPVKDFNSLRERAVISNELYNAQIKKFQKAPKLVKVPSGEQLYTLPLNSPFLGPFNIFVEDEISQFPKYLTKEEAHDIMKEPEKPFLSGKIEFNSNKIYAGTLGRPKTKPVLAADIFSQTGSSRPSPRPTDAASSNRLPPYNDAHSVVSTRKTPSVASSRRAPSVSSAMNRQPFIEKDLINNIRVDGYIDSSEDNFYGGNGKLHKVPLQPENEYYSEESVEILRPQPMQAPRINRRPPSRVQTRTTQEQTIVSTQQTQQQRRTRQRVQQQTTTQESNSRRSRTQQRERYERPAPIQTRRGEYEYYEEDPQTPTEYEYYSDEPPPPPPKSSRSTRSSRAVRQPPPPQPQRTTKYRYDVDSRTSHHYPSQPKKQQIQETYEYYSDYNDAEVEHEYEYEYYSDEVPPPPPKISRSRQSVHHSRQQQQQQQPPAKHQHHRNQNISPPRSHRRSIQNEQPQIQQRVSERISRKTSQVVEEHPEPQPHYRAHSRYQNRLKIAVEETKSVTSRPSKEDLRRQQRSFIEDIPYEEVPSTSERRSRKSTAQRPQKKKIVQEYSYDSECEVSEEYGRPPMKGIKKLDARKLHVAKSSSAPPEPEYEYYDDGFVEEEEEIQEVPQPKHRRYHYMHH